jgi:YidC/Oxa1 family membrane protein insertase
LVDRFHIEETVAVKRRNWILLAVLVLALLTLSACGAPAAGVDFRTAEADNIWQAFVFWLAGILYRLAELLSSWGVAFYWGWAIILFTLIVKLITFPLTLSQVRGMQAQKNLQPKIAELQKKYGKDRERLAQEQMRLYKEAGVNPLSGCLPLLIQMPILIGLYAALVTVGPLMEKAGVNAAFYWIPNLTYPSFSGEMGGIGWIFSAWQTGFAPMPGFPGGESGYYVLIAYLILPVLLIVTQFVMQKWMTPTPMGDSDQARMSQNMSLIMTLFFGWFTLQVPAGLTLYWVTSNLLQMLQQWMTTRFFMKQPAAPVAVAAAGAAAVTIDGQATSVGEDDRGAGSTGSAKGTTTAKGAPGKPASRPPAKPSTTKPATAKSGTAKPSTAPAGGSSAYKKGKQPPPVNPDGQAKTKGK